MINALLVNGVLGPGDVFIGALLLGAFLSWILVK